MNRLALPALFLVLTTSPALACDDEGTIFPMIFVSPVGEPAVTFEVSEQQSVEGGEWQVWFGPDGKTVQNLVRGDYGEGGSSETRLIVASPDAYAITFSLYLYSAPANIPGSTTIREEKDIFVYCKGKLLVPEGDIEMDQAYLDKAKETLAEFDAPEVKQYVQGLKR
jgi:hypothetical protein